MVIDNYRRWKSRLPSKTVQVVDPRANPNLRFRAGIDQIFARRLRAKLNDPRFHCSVQPLQIMRCDESDNRWTVNSKGELLAAEKKQALDQINIALIAHEYDIRINVATEIAAPVTEVGDVRAAPPVNRNLWVVERRKKRTSYTCKDAHMNKWRIDYTEVDIVTKLSGTANASNKIKKEIEVEFELETAPMLDWLRERDGDAVISKTRVLAEQLTQLLDYCIPFESESEKESSLLVVNDTYFDFEINKLDAILTGADAVQPGRKKSDFLGSMPVNLTRQNLIEVQKTDYFITEKSDGIRYLLYVIPPPRSTDPADGIAVLVDRSRTIFKFRGCETVGKALGVGTILDGELVFNRSLKENVFLVFDTLLFRRQPLVELLFGERLEKIRSEILSTYSRNLPAVLAQESALNAQKGLASLPVKPLALVRKVFVPRREFGVLLSKMRLEDGERVFFDPERAAQPGVVATSRRHHKSDGFIFQPNAKYVFSKHYELMKWKWAELRSVDLQINIPMEATSNSAGGEWPIYLMCGGPDGTQINCTKRGDTNVGLGAYFLLFSLSYYTLFESFSPITDPPTRLHHFPSHCLPTSLPNHQVSSTRTGC